VKRNDRIRADLPPRGRVLFDLLVKNNPIPITALFAAVNSTPGIYDQRQMQQRLGGIMTSINRCIRPEGLVVVPGEPRGTYRLRKCVT